jgi:cell fate regulator YaaT (PSP1 superfamily)
VTATAEKTVATHLVEVEFKGNRRAFFTWTGETPPPLKAAVIVAVDRGEDFGRVHALGDLADKRKQGTTHGKASPNELPKAVRLATAQEIDRAVRLRADEHAVRKAAIEIARELKLDLKVSDTEWQWDRRKLTAYFTAEDRVDFRELVRRLERRFSTRVHMWHIGVRDEARRLDGIGRCGRQFCSASWLPELRPVKSSTAKDQRLSTLNPAQISGTCGRLMCCLRHEHEFYVQQRKRFPKEGRVLVTTSGEEKVVLNDIFRDQVTLRTPTGEERIIPLAQLRRELGEGVLPSEDEIAASVPVELVELKGRDRDEEPAPALNAEDAEHGAEDADEDVGSGDDGPSAAPGASPTSADAASSAGDKRRGRRRRGRRGGRRGRPDGGPNGGGAPNAPNSPPSAPPAGGGAS